MDPRLSLRAFRDGKRSILAELAAAIDHSPKGSVDAPISAWVAEFNRREHYVTTSSCSGRVALFAHAPSEEDAENAAGGVADAAGSADGDAPLPSSSKGAGRWLLVTHGPDLPDGAALSRALATAPPECTEAGLKVEPFILHILCQDVAAARALHALAVSCGFRESGIGIGNSGRVIVAVRSTAHALDVPLVSRSRVMAEPAYLDALCVVVARRFRAIERRRGAFMERALAEFPAPPAPTVQLPTTAAAGAVNCSECGGSFASRNALFKHLVPADAVQGGGVFGERTRRCPAVAKTAFPAPPPRPVEDSCALPAPVPQPTGTPALLACSWCGAASFASRNKLFQHLQTCRATGGAAVLASAATASRPEAALGCPPLRTLPAIAPTVLPSAIDVAAATAARAASLELMRKVESRQEDARRSQPEPGKLHWRQESPATPASPRCWGHSAVLLRELLGGGAALTHGVVAAFGGFLLGGGGGGGVHGRSNETHVLDTRTRAWQRCVVRGGRSVADSAAGPACTAPVPAPRMRHASVAAPLPATAGAAAAGQLAEALFIHGGRTGPAGPLDDSWVGRVARASVDGASEVSWSPCRVARSSQLPPARWGHSLHVLPPACEGFSDTVLLLFGGRDGSRCLGDMWEGNLLLRGGGAEDDVSWLPLECSGPAPGPRCYHGATLLAPSGGAPPRLVVHGGMGDAVGSSPGDEAGVPLFGHGRLLGADTIYILDVCARSWVRLAPALPASLQPRMSHSLVALPAAADRGDAYSVLVLGGEVCDPANSAAELVNVVMNSEGAGTVFCNSLIESCESASAEIPVVAPLMLRASTLLVPPPAAAGAAGPVILTVGGGCVVFAFGSYASPTSEAALPTALHSEAAAMHGSVAPSSHLIKTRDGASAAVDLVVAVSETQWARVAAAERGWFDDSRKCRPCAGRGGERLVRIPITEAAAASLQPRLRATGADLTLGPTLQWDATTDRFVALLESGAATIVLDSSSPVSNASAPQGDLRGGVAGMARAARELRALLAANPDLVTAEAADRLVTPGAPGGLPRRTEWVGDVLVLARDSMTDPVWPRLVAPPTTAASDDPRLVSAPAWDCLARVFGAERVARAAAIDPGKTRRSRLTLLRYFEYAPASSVGADASSDLALLLRGILPPEPRAGETPIAAAAGPLPPQTPEAAVQLARAVAGLRAAAPPPGGWALVRDAGVTYVLDVTRLMLSSGNISEKLRVGALPAAGETVVDLFAGIGYWTLPILVHARAAHVHACDWNPDAVACLRLGLAANRVATDRVTLWPGDNAQLAGSSVEGTADRVMLGLIPTSEGAWGTAVRLLRPATGGWLHVHMNRPEEGIQAFAAELEGALAALAAGVGRRWACSVRHVERVKSYAPRVWHVVYDVEARPR